MASAQTAIFEEKSTYFHYLEYKIRSSTSFSSLKEHLAKLLKQDSQVHTLIAFSPKAYHKMNPENSPQNFESFKELEGTEELIIPRTQYDLFFWLHSSSISDNLDKALAIDELISPFSSDKAINTGFTYHDSRDLTGFVDGSANPKEEKRQTAALIPAGQTGEAGSFILTQKWQHQLKKFNRLPQSHQEKIIGRTKPDSIELEGDDMPATSHVSRTDVKVDGVAQKIYRRSAPYSNGDEHGLYFLAFSCEQSRFDIQLRRMLGMTEDGQHDHLMHYSTALSSAYYFAPSQEDLKQALS